MTEYLIKKGNHYASGLHFGVHFGITEQKYKVRFSKECLYTPDWENDWNKLCGWSYGLHHKNSIRVCWRPGGFTPYTALVNGPKAPTQIELCIYVYENGKRSTSELIFLVDVEVDFELDLKYINNLITLTSSYYTKSSYNKTLYKLYFSKPSWGYRLYPYIGGTNIAVQDNRIYLERL